MKKFVILFISFMFIVTANCKVVGAQEKVLRYSDWVGPQLWVNQLKLQMFDMINKNTKGEIKIKPYFAESLAKLPDQFRAVQSGIADIGWWVIGSPNGPDRLSVVVTLPFMGLDTQEKGTRLMEKIFREVPEIKNEFNGVVVPGDLWVSFCMGQAHTVKKQVKTPADLKGMKINPSDRNWIGYLQTVGATPVLIPVPDAYMALERNVVEGQFIHFPAAMEFKILELFKYHTIINAGATMQGFIVNGKVWNSFSDSTKKAFIDAYKWYVSEVLRREISENEKKAYELSKKLGHTIYTPTPNELKQWVDAAKPSHEKWIKELEAQGLPAKKVYEKVRKIISEYKE